MKNYGKENKLNIEDEQNVHDFFIINLFLLIIFDNQNKKKRKNPYGKRIREMTNCIF
jgi:hypothetical protein